MDLGSLSDEILTSSLKRWRSRNIGNFILSIGLQIRSSDPLKLLPVLSENCNFTFAWDNSPDICISAAGCCSSKKLSGEKRFQNAEEFNRETFSIVEDVSVNAPIHSRPKIFMSFTFFSDSDLFNKQIFSRAILPKWQLSSSEGSTWLRINSFIKSEEEIKGIINELTSMGERLKNSLNTNKQSVNYISQSSINDWKKMYREIVSKGITLLKTNELEKLVIAVKQHLVLKENLDPLDILIRLRCLKDISCRFLWKMEKSIYFGASPERILSVKSNKIRVDALAGTSKSGLEEEGLLYSEKNLLEHKIVVDSIASKLLDINIRPNYASIPCVVRQGHLAHLLTPIFAEIKGKHPLELISILHPTPAVLGSPRDLSMDLLKNLEPFERGYYAAPIGWIDNSGDTEFRVAIRFGEIKDDGIDLIAGAGLVKGSLIDDELDEISLKLGILANQLSIQ